MELEPNKRGETKSIEWALVALASHVLSVLAAMPFHREKRLDKALYPSFPRARG